MPSSARHTAAARGARPRGAPRPRAQAARDAAKEYQAAHKKLTGTLEKRKEGKGEWKDPKVLIWPPAEWKKAAERDRPSETEQLLDTLAEAFLGSRPKQGTWPLKSRKTAATVFREEVQHRQPLSGAVDAKTVGEIVTYNQNHSKLSHLGIWSGVRRTIIAGTSTKLL